MSLVALTRAETVTGPTGTFEFACGWIVLMIGPRPVAVGEGAAGAAAVGDGAGGAASGVVPMLTGDEETRSSLALTTDPGRAPSRGRSAGRVQPAANAPMSPTMRKKRRGTDRGGVL